MASLMLVNLFSVAVFSIYYLLHAFIVSFEIILDLQRVLRMEENSSTSSRENSTIRKMEEPEPEQQPEAQTETVTETTENAYQAS